MVGDGTGPADAGKSDTHAGDNQVLTERSDGAPGSALGNDAHSKQSQRSDGAQSKQSGEASDDAPDSAQRDTVIDVSQRDTSQEVTPDSRQSVNLGPLSLLGFGPSEAEHLGRARAAGRRSLVTFAALIIIVAGLKVARPVLVPFTVSVFIATLAAPFVFYLRKRKWPVELAVTVVVAAGLLLFGAVFGVVVGTLNAFVQAAPGYQELLVQRIIAASSVLENWGIEVTPENLYSLVQPAAIMSFVGETLSSLADILSDTFLVMLMTVFVLFEAVVLPNKIRAALNDPNADLSRGLRVVARIKAYVVVKTSTSLATGIILGIALYAIDVDFALLWGLLAFFLNFIPNIGSVIAAVPAVLLALLQQGLGGASLTALIFLIVNMSIGSILEPRVMGKSMNLSPLVVIVSLVFWGWLWGGVGMLLSVPLTMAIRIMLDGNEGTRPFAILLAGGGTDPNETPNSYRPRPSAGLGDSSPPAD